MEADALERARLRLAGDPDRQTNGAVRHAHEQIDALAARAAELEATLPDRVGSAVREGMRAEALPVARQVAELRGISAQLVRRLDRIEQTLAAERQARVDDLSMLVELVASGWESVDRRLARLEATFRSGREAVVYAVERG